MIHFYKRGRFGLRFAVFYSDRAEQGGRMASVNEETGSGYYSKGNEAFVAENSFFAIDLYTAALGIDHLFADFLLQEHMPTSSLISLNKPRNG